ncbi:MAG: DUF2007 domain-containing protein [Chloroflexi bacterium]|nr:DUF2007 domain-containing protein [Chloroflexota bacterium]
MNRDEQLVEVYRSPNALEAQVIKSLLESYGIPSLLKSNAAPSVLIFTVNGLGEVRVMVPASRAEEARKLIKEDGYVEMD